MSKELEIIIRGQPKTGKSTMAHGTADMLRYCGVNVEVQDGEDKHPRPGVPMVEMGLPKVVDKVTIRTEKVDRRDLSRELELGNGNVLVTKATRRDDGAVAIVLEPQEVSRPVGMGGPGKVGGYTPGPKDIVLIFKNLEGAEVFRRALDDACTLLGGN